MRSAALSAADAEAFASAPAPKRPVRWHILVFLAPAASIYTVVMLLPLVESLWLSFFTTGADRSVVFTGFGNYARLLLEAATRYEARKYIAIAHKLLAVDPRHFHFVTTFSMKGFGDRNWTTETIRDIDAEMQRGAIGVKVWKNIGMVEKDAQGHLIMLDNPGFDGVLSKIFRKNT